MGKSRIIHGGIMKLRLIWWFVGLLNGLAFIPLLGYARSIDMSKAGVSLWIFLVVGVCIILLQLVPAIIVVISLLASIKEKEK